MLIAPILEGFGYFDEEKGKKKNKEFSDKERNKDGIQDSEEEDQKNNSFIQA